MTNFYEFFAGGGMARAGLGSGWRCTFANDFSPMKAAAYKENWGSSHFREGDVGAIKTADLPGHPDLVWASTPCQDLSLAGNAAGFGQADAVSATRSGAFWPWWRLMQALIANGRKPRTIVFENVVGALSSNKGADFAVIANAFHAAGYALGALVIDARHFLPQSRPRLFVIGVDKVFPIPSAVHRLGPQVPWHPTSVQNAFDRLPKAIQAEWVWWALPSPMMRRPELSSMIQDEPTGVQWHTPVATKALVAMMTPANKAKLTQAQALGRRLVGTVYKRTRPDASGKKACRAEIRFDGIAGCLRTPSGGSSRQTVMVVDGKSVRSRLLSTREAARLMGLPETYNLPASYNDAYHVCGDGVAVPVVRFLAQHLLEPILAAAGDASRVEAIGKHPTRSLRRIS